MSILTDWQIAELAKQGMIEPFVAEHIGTGAVSFGLSSYGYDVTTADEFKIFTNVNAVVIDPKNFSSDSFVEAKLQQDGKSRFIIAPPSSFVLARTVEYIRIPRNVVGLMTVKSTYARCGLVSPPTVLEPEWEGHITIEISNTTPLPARIYANEGIAQVLFLQASEACLVSYADRKGKYQGQTGITLPKVNSANTFESFRGFVWTHIKPDAKSRLVDKFNQVKGQSADSASMDTEPSERFHGWIWAQLNPDTKEALIKQYEASKG